MRAFSSAQRVDLRALPRELVNRPARVIESGYVHDAVVKDISPAGARLAFQGPPPASAHIVMVELSTATGHACEVIWRKGAECGVRFVRSQNLKGLVSSQFDAAKRVWLSAGGRR